MAGFKTLFATITLVLVAVGHRVCAESKGGTESSSKGVDRSTQTSQTSFSEKNIWTRLYRIEERGTPLYAPDYGAYLTDNTGLVVSPFHDVDLFADGGGCDDDGSTQRLYHMVVEIPQSTNAKMEISGTRPMNPIAHDLLSDTRPRFVSSVYPVTGYMWNYGAFPQTWEDPSVMDPDTRQLGDGDGLDAIEIGRWQLPIGSVVRVKAVGALAMIDQGATDWKVLVVDADGPLADQVDDLDDVQRLFPDLLERSVDWLRKYKRPDGKSFNEFAFGGRPQNAGFARKVIAAAHRQWRDMMDCPADAAGSDKLPSRTNTTLHNTHTVTREQARNMMTGPDPRDFTRWHYVIG